MTPRIEKIRKPKKIFKRKGETLEAIDLSESQWPPLLEDGYFAARVVEVHKKYAFVCPEPTLATIDIEDLWLSTVARKFLLSDRKERNFLAVGDRVLCREADLEEYGADIQTCVIEYRSPRISKIYRIDPMTKQREHVIAANATQVVIVASFCVPRVKWGLIDRFLVLAESEELRATILLNKEDLLKDEDPEFRAECAREIALYRQMGYEVRTIQATDEAQIAALAPLFAKQVSLICGHSGVGKSSIINALQPNMVQDVEWEPILLKGRHTTSYSKFIQLGTGGTVIDTPGIRSLSLPPSLLEDLSWNFVELRPHIPKCRFRGCTHESEPECAVLKAVEAGTIDRRRFDSYLNLRGEIKSEQ